MKQGQEVEIITDGQLRRGRVSDIKQFPPRRENYLWVKMDSWPWGRWVKEVDAVPVEGIKIKVRHRREKPKKLKTIHRRR